MKKLCETVRGDRVVVMHRGVAESGTVRLVREDGTRVVELDDYSSVNEAKVVDVRPSA